jgi:hypothetical protein
MIGYLVPNESIRESAVATPLNPMIDTGHVRPNLSGVDRLALPMGGTQAAAVPAPRVQRRETDLALGVTPDRLTGTTHAYPIHRRCCCSAAPARPGRRLHLGLLRLPRRPARDGRPGPRSALRRRGGDTDGRDRVLAGRPLAGLVAQRRHCAGGSTLGSARRGRTDTVLPVRPGQHGTRPLRADCGSSHPCPPPHPDRRTTV